MDEEQQEILNKEFKVDDTHTISRGDYEALDRPMAAMYWSDDEMQELADYINRNMAVPSDEVFELGNGKDLFAFYFEDCAVRMGMKYRDEIEGTDNVK